MILATRNAGKVREFNSLLCELLGAPLISLKDYGKEVPEVVEDADTFEGNALKKALEVSLATGLSVMADDSGLEVDALGGAPGVISARYAGEQGDDAANNAKLISTLEEVLRPGDGDFVGATARYVAVLAVCLAPDAEGQHIAQRLGVSAVPEGHGVPAFGVASRRGDRIVLLFRGTCEGEITRFPKGEGGFGYDPYFRLPQWGQTMAEIPLAQKNTISHRGAVVAKLLGFSP